MYVSDKLPAICREADAEKAEPLIAKWRENQLSMEDTVWLAEMLYVTGQQLNYCAETPEWKGFIDNYQRYLFDEDEIFRHAYAVIEQCPENCTDEQGCYKRFAKPGEWLTESRELGLGLIDYNGKEKKSIQSVGACLRKILDDAEQNIRLFIAIKTILDTAVEVVELIMPDNKGTLMDPDARLNAAITLYNIRIEELNEKRFRWNSEESLLEKALKMLPAIDIEKLKPCTESLTPLDNVIFKENERGEWLKEKIYVLKYNNDFSFESLIENGQ